MKLTPDSGVILKGIIVGRQRKYDKKFRANAVELVRVNRELFPALTSLQV